jgi:hypothetical protein
VGEALPVYAYSCQRRPWLNPARCDGLTSVLVDPASVAIRLPFALSPQMRPAICGDFRCSRLGAHWAFRAGCPSPRPTAPQPDQ